MLNDFSWCEVKCGFLNMFVIAENSSSLPQSLKVSFPELSAWPAVRNYILLYVCLCFKGCTFKSVKMFCLKATMPNL